MDSNINITDKKLEFAKFVVVSKPKVEDYTVKIPPAFFSIKTLIPDFETKEFFPQKRLKSHNLNFLKSIAVSLQKVKIPRPCFFLFNPDLGEYS